MADYLTWMLYFFIFLLGLVVGRITMAIQVAMMRKWAEERRQQNAAEGGKKKSGKKGKSS